MRQSAADRPNGNYLKGTGRAQKLWNTLPRKLMALHNKQEVLHSVPGARAVPMSRIGTPWFYATFLKCVMAWYRRTKTNRPQQIVRFGDIGCAPYPTDFGAMRNEETDIENLMTTVLVYSRMQYTTLERQLTAHAGRHMPSPQAARKHAKTERMDAVLGRTKNAATQRAARIARRAARMAAGA